MKEVLPISDPGRGPWKQVRPKVFGQVGFPFHAGVGENVFRDQLRAALDVLPVDALLAGMRGPRDRWESCLEETAARGIPLYLWHPLLENVTGRYGDLESVGLDGGRAEWATAHLPGSASGFRFFCPNQPDAQRMVLDTVANLIETTKAAGLFLDKIRYPSPASGLRTSLGCFCSHCQVAAQEFGIDLSEVRSRLSYILSKRIDATALTLLGVGSGEVSDPLLARWHRFRCQSIAKIVAEAVEIARRARCSIGLDLFAPALSRLVGQDYGLLAPLADWLKPMLYCRSWVPSGFPIEIDGLIQGLLIGGRASVAATLGYRVPARRRLLETGVSQTLAVAQAEEAQRRAGAVPSLAGIEVANRPGICRMTPRLVARYGRLLRASGIAGVVASPDIVLASHENLASLANQFLT